MALAYLQSPLACDYSHSYTTRVCIDPNNGVQDQECLHGNGTVCCKSLLYALQNSRNASTLFELSNGSHTLDSQLDPFNNTCDISLVGEGIADTIVTCEGNQQPGLAFLHVDRVLIANITFLNCGTVINGYYDAETVYAAIHLIACRDICISYANVSLSSDSLGVSILDAQGNNVIEYSKFIRNTIARSYTYSGGGGVRVEFATDYNDSTKLFFTQCTFRDNLARLKYTLNTTDHTPRNLFNNTYLGSGGGLAITVGRVTGKSIEISNCTFQRNEAISGGGMLAHFHNNATSNILRVENCSFDENDSPYPNTTGAGGGGLRIYHNTSANDIQILSCNFTGNHARTGGALSIMPAHYDSPTLPLINITGCNFKRNIGHIGAAVEVTLLPYTTKGTIPRIVFSRLNLTCNWVENKQSKDMNTYETGFAAMYINRMNVEFRDWIVFEGNNGSALGAVGTYLDFTHQATANFSDNRGSKGAAISLLGSVTILIDDDTEMNFVNNFADVFGGAIHNRYTEKDLLNYKKCFIHHDKVPTEPNLWKSSFQFTGNNATLQGDAIFTTSLYPCYYYHERDTEIASVNDTFIHWPNWHFSPPADNTIASDGAKALVQNTTLKVYPGHATGFALTVLDDVGHNMSLLTVFRASVDDTTLASIDPEFRYIASNTIKIRGKANSTVKLMLSAISDRAWHIHIDVEIQKCPLGFVSENTNLGLCRCREKRFNEKLLCNETELTSRFESGHWLGKVETKNGTEVLAAAICHVKFCNVCLEHKYQMLPKSINASNICVEDRQGVLCGQCRDEYGPIVNGEDFDCQLCNSSHTGSILKYISSIYIPLTLLFALIIFVNVRLTTGPANAFIFYAQIVSSTFDLYADGHINLLNITGQHSFKHLKGSFLNLYRAPYGIFNLEFIENFLKGICLGKKYNALDILQLDYLVAVYPLLLIIALSITVRVKRCFSKKKHIAIRTSLMHAFAAFLLLAYSKFAIVSTYILNTHPLYDEDYNFIEKRAYLAGQYRSTDKTYIIRYYFPAILVLIVCVCLPPVILLGFPIRWIEKLCCRLRGCKKIHPSKKMKIFLNVFQGCYKERMKFFASMYFFFRLFLYVTFLLTNTLLEQYILQQIACTVFIMIIALCWPYKHNFQNYVDLFIFIDLAIVNAISLYLYMYFEQNPHSPPPVGHFVVQYILVLLPLVYMISYIVWYFCKPSPEKIRECVDTSCLSPMLRSCLESEQFSGGHRRQQRRRGSYHSLDSDSQTETSTTPRRVTMTEVTLGNAERSSPQREIEEILNRAEDGNTYKPLPQRGSINRDTPGKDSGLNTRDYGATDNATPRTTSVEIHNYI